MAGEDRCCNCLFWAFGMAIVGFFLLWFAVPLALLAGAQLQVHMREEGYNLFERVVVEFGCILFGAALLSLGANWLLESSRNKLHTGHSGGAECTVWISMFAGFALFGCGVVTIVVGLWYDIVGYNSRRHIFDPMTGKRLQPEGTDTSNASLDCLMCRTPSTALLLNVGDPEAIVVVGAVLVISAVLTVAVLRGRSRSQELAVPLLG